MTPEEKWLLKDKYNNVVTEQFEADCKRLKHGEPLAYVIGWVPFLAAKIYLDSRPLIPRPETEYWVQKAVEYIRSNGMRQSKILDLCAGSGCIGVSVLKAIPNTFVDFVEIDQTHHATIQKNLRENGISEDRYRILGGDLFEQVPNTYDAILTNPPYINPDRIEQIEKNVLDHEPHQALFGGIDGVELIGRILIEAPKHLSANGVLYIEHEPEQTEAIRTLLPGIESHQDQFGVVRFSVFNNYRKK